MRVRFAGISASSPFGVLLRASIGDAATVVEESADVVVDCFGPYRAASNERVWHVVDGGGEPILNPFCLLEACCRAPYVTSLFVVERRGEIWSVLAEAHISNRSWYRDLLDRAARVCAHLVASALRNDETTRAKPFHGTPIARRRSKPAAAFGLMAANVRRAAAIIRETAMNERWAVGALDVPVFSLTRSQTIRPQRWIRADNDNAYYADPFPLPGEPDVLLCEKYDRRRRSGSLCAIALAGDRVTDERPLLMPRSGTHVSYPSLFEDGDRTFLLPEMAASGELALFELSQGALRQVCVVDRGTRIADPTLFRHDGLYWIAYCDQDLGTHGNLCLLYAQRPEGPWIPHPLNPVKIDVRSSRPGGTLFRVGGNLFRPAQDCSAAYGAALVVNEVRVCTPERYEEVPVALLTPDRHGAFPHGLHTLSIDGNRVLVDGKRHFFDPSRYWIRIRARVRRGGRKPALEVQSCAS